MLQVCGTTKVEDFCRRDKKGIEVLNDPGLITASDPLADLSKHIVIEQNLLAGRDGAEYSTVNGKRPSVLVGSRLRLRLLENKNGSPSRWRWRHFRLPPAAPSTAP